MEPSGELKDKRVIILVLNNGNILLAVRTDWALLSVQTLR